MTDPPKSPAAVVLLVRGPLVLALTRGSAVHDLHLPGGKSEPEDASMAHTAARELAEETGLYLDPGSLRPLCRYRAHTGRPCEAFTTSTDQGWPEHYRPTEAGWPGWVPAEALLQPWCTYGQECATVFEAWRREDPSRARWGRRERDRSLIAMSVQMAQELARRVW